MRKNKCVRIIHPRDRIKVPQTTWRKHKNSVYDRSHIYIRKGGDEWLSAVVLQHLTVIWGNGGKADPGSRD